MSSILKALRKLEEEKAARRDGSVDIARDILRLPRQRRSAPWRLSVAVAGAVAVLGLAGFALVGRQVGFSPQAPVSPPTPAPSGAAVPAVTTPRPSPPVLPEEVVQEVIPAEVPVRLPAVQAAVPPPAPPSSPPAASAARETVSAAAASDHIPAASGAPAAAMPAAVAASMPAVPVPAPPSNPPADAPPLAVTGIAFHSDPESRMAVVNGLPVMSGTIIEGMKVEEILPDRVRFSGGGSVFEISLEP